MATDIMALTEALERIVKKQYPVLFESIGEIMLNDPDWTWVERIFRVTNTDTWQHEYTHQQRDGLFEAGDETDPYPLEELAPPVDQTFELDYWRKAFEYTDFFVEFANNQAKFFMDVEKRLQLLPASAVRTMGKRAAQILLDGYSGTLLTCLDDQPLFDAAHTHMGASGTFSNLMTQKLSYNSLVAMGQLTGVQNLVDASGSPITINLDRLLVSPKNYDTAVHLMSSPVKIGGSNDEPNPLYHKYDVVKCPWFLESVHTGASEYYMAFDSRRHTMTAMIAEILRFRTERNPGHDSARLLALQLFDMWFEGWEGTAASDGSVAAL